MKPESFPFPVLQVGELTALPFSSILYEIPLIIQSFIRCGNLTNILIQGTRTRINAFARVEVELVYVLGQTNIVTASILFSQDFFFRRCSSYGLFGGAINCNNVLNCFLFSYSFFMHHYIFRPLWAILRWCSSV
jgi:hypothetical protein